MVIITDDFVKGGKGGSLNCWGRGQRLFKSFYPNTITLFNESFASDVSLNASAVFSIGNL